MRQGQLFLAWLVALGGALLLKAPLLVLVRSCVEDAARRHAGFEHDYSAACAAWTSFSGLVCEGDQCGFDLAQRAAEGSAVAAELLGCGYAVVLLLVFERYRSRSSFVHSAAEQDDDEADDYSTSSEEVWAPMDEFPSVPLPIATM